MKLCYSYENRRFYFTDPAAPGNPLDPEPHIVRFGDEQRAFFKSEFIARSYLDIFSGSTTKATGPTEQPVSAGSVVLPTSVAHLSVAEAARCAELLRELLHRLDPSRPLSHAA